MAKKISQLLKIDITRIGACSGLLYSLLATCRHTWRGIRVSKADLARSDGAQSRTYTPHRMSGLPGESLR